MLLNKSCSKVYSKPYWKSAVRAVRACPRLPESQRVRRATHTHSATMALKNRMLCYVMGTLAAGAAISLALNVGILLTAFPGWIDNVGEC